MDLTYEGIRNRINLLLASAFAEVQRRGSLSEGLQFDIAAINELNEELTRNNESSFTLQVITLRKSDTAEPVTVALNKIP